MRFFEIIDINKYQKGPSSHQILINPNPSFKGYIFEEIFYGGISACFHDCYYRASFADNMKYIALLDVDEILIPREANQTSLLELLKRIDEPELNSFSFRNAFMELGENPEPSGGISKDPNLFCTTANFVS